MRNMLTVARKGDSILNDADNYSLCFTCLPLSGMACHDISEFLAQCCCITGDRGPLYVTTLTRLRDEIAFGDVYAFGIESIDLGTQQQNEGAEVEEQQQNQDKPNLPNIVVQKEGREEGEELQPQLHEYG